MAVGVRREITGGREEKLVIIIVIHDSSNRDETISAGTVFDDDRLTPFGG
jgi:hypothetical protein